MHLLRYPITTLTAPGRWKQSLEEHRDLVKAILARDSAKAQQLAEHHFTTARDIRLALWEDNIV
jgi:DNA-binding GntR family transcriptional regulator